jgi:hypothetical protein
MGQALGDYFPQSRHRARQSDRVVAAGRSLWAGSLLGPPAVSLAVERFDERRDGVAPKPREGALSFCGDPAVGARELGDSVPGVAGVRPFPQPPLRRLAFTESDRRFALTPRLVLGT